VWSNNGFQRAANRLVGCRTVWGAAAEAARPPHREAHTVLMAILVLVVAALGGPSPAEAQPKGGGRSAS
jgi:hypothetical protein